MRRPLVLALVAIGVVVVLVGGLVTALVLTSRPAAPRASGAEASWPTPARIDWGACENSQLRLAQAQCAHVRVPLDWSSPKDGRTVSLAISRVRHTASPYEGVMLTNPGGPGGSGLTLSTTGANVPRDIGARYDWIGIDPRGIGDSRPRLSCDPHYANGPRPAYTPASAANITRWRERAAAYASACGRRGGDLLAHMTTRDTANDFEYLRLALGQSQISYYGYSYGTYLGQVLATLYPRSIKRMVLDSNVDPSEVWYRANLSQSVAFQTTIEAWFDWLAQHDRTYGLGSTRAEVEASYDRLQQRLADSPADGVYGSAELADTLLYAGYFQSLWTGLGSAFSRALNDGDTAAAIRYWRLLDMPDDDNEYAGYVATECTDAASPAWSTWARDTRQVARKAPFAAWLNTWFNAPCLTWPVRAGTPVTVDGTKAPPALLIDETLDAATPYAGSVEVRKLFPRSRLLAEPGGTTHADSLSGNGCVDGVIADYLADGSLPTRKSGDGPDTTCKPLPVPSP